MPAKSKAQQMAAGAALAAKRGEKKKSELKGASRSMANSMSEKQLEDFAATKRKGKPGHVSGACEFVALPCWDRLAAIEGQPSSSLLRIWRDRYRKTDTDPSKAPGYLVSAPLSAVPANPRTGCARGALVRRQAIITLIATGPETRNKDRTNFAFRAGLPI